MKRIHNYIKEYHPVAQAIIWGTVWFIVCCSAALLAAIFIEFYGLFYGG